MLNCLQTAVTVKDFSTLDNYAEWTLQASYTSKLNETSLKNADIYIMFQTRQSNGIVFFAASFSRMEHAIIEVSFTPRILFR